MTIDVVKILWVAIIVTTITLGCNSETKFDQAKWLIRKDADFPFRKYMVKDLVQSRKLIGLYSNQIINLLGEPQYFDSSKLSYQIETEFGRDIDPIRTVYLNVYFSADSISKTFMIETWKK